ncbi:MAG: hypothetical protein AB1Z98_11110 [Nannocystaceae bacterium]
MRTLVLGELERLRHDPKLRLPATLATPVEPSGSVAARVRDNGHAALGWQLPVAALTAGRSAAVEGVLRLGDTQVERRADDFEPGWRGRPSPPDEVFSIALNNSPGWLRLHSRSSAIGTRAR